MNRHDVTYDVTVTIRAADGQPLAELIPFSFHDDRDAQRWMRDVRTVHAIRGELQAAPAFADAFRRITAAFYGATVDFGVRARFS